MTDRIQTCAAAPGVQIVSAGAMPVTTTADILFEVGDRTFILTRPRLICAGVRFGSDDPPAHLWLHETVEGCFRVLVEHDPVTGLPSVSASGVSDLDAALDLLTARKRAPRGTRLRNLQNEMEKETS